MAAEATVRVLFCGLEFPAALELTRDAVKPFPHVQLDVWPREDVPDKIGNYDMCVVRMSQLSAPVIARAQRLKLIIQYGVGLEGVDIEAATRAGIKVARIASDGTGNALSCAEHAIYLVLGLLRDQKAMAESVAERRLGEPLGETLYGKTALIIGFGNIGKQLELRLSAFGVHVLVISRSWSEKKTCFNHKFEIGGKEQLDDFASRADIVFTCCTLTPETAGMVDEKLISKLKRGSRLVNVARGGLLDYKAVMSALDSGHLGGLAMDVAWYEPFDPADPILKHPKVLITPHIAGVTQLSYSSMSKIIADCAQQLHKGFLTDNLNVQFVN